MRRLLLGVVLCVAVAGCFESPVAPTLKPTIDDGCTSVVQPDGSVEHGCPGR